MTGPAANRPTILVVEDEAPLLTLLRYNLEKQGFRVEEAADGQEALLRVAEAPPDLVLLDWMLPTLSGIEVCRQIRRRPGTRNLPIIMVTARTEDQDAVRALDTGADDYIAKPFAMEAAVRMRSCCWSAVKPSPVMIQFRPSVPGRPLMVYSFPDRETGLSTISLCNRVDRPVRSVASNCSSTVVAASTIGARKLKSSPSTRRSRSAELPPTCETASVTASPSASVVGMCRRASAPETTTAGIASSSITGASGAGRTWMVTSARERFPWPSVTVNSNASVPK